MTRCQTCGMSTSHRFRLCDTCLTAKAGKPVSDPQTLGRLAELFVFRPTAAVPASAGSASRPRVLEGVGAGTGAAEPVVDRRGDALRRSAAPITRRSLKQNGDPARIPTAKGIAAPTTPAA